MNSRTAEKLVNGNIEVTIPIYIRRESNLVTLDRLPETPKTEWQRLAPLQRRLVLGFHLLDKCEENPSKSSVAIAKEESMDRSLFYKTMSLVNLAPDIVEEIMSDPPTFDFSVKKIFSHRLPVDWNEQRKFLGLPEKDYAAKRLISMRSRSRGRHNAISFPGGD